MGAALVITTTVEQRLLNQTDIMGLQARPGAQPPSWGPTRQTREGLAFVSLKGSGTGPGLGWALSPLGVGEPVLHPEDDRLVAKFLLWYKTLTQEEPLSLNGDCSSWVQTSQSQAEGRWRPWGLRVWGLLVQGPACLVPELL